MSYEHIKELATNNNGKLPDYAWPGGYPLYYIDGECSALCPACANKSMSDDELPKFRPVAYDINYEDANLFCEQCNGRIESAYAEDKDSASAS